MRSVPSAEQRWRVGSLGRVLIIVAIAALLIVLCAPRWTNAQARVTNAQAGRTESPRLDAEGEARVRQIAAQLRCPVCQAVSLAESPSGLSAEMMEVLREQVALGKSPQEIQEYFVGRYGEWILLEPKREGWNLLVYVLPAGLVLLGLAGVVYVVRRWTAPESGPA